MPQEWIQQQWQDPRVQHGVYGAGIGAGLGGLLSLLQGGRFGRDSLLGALAGGGIGAGATHLLGQGQEDIPEDPEAAQQAAHELTPAQRQYLEDMDDPRMHDEMRRFDQQMQQHRDAGAVIPPRNVARPGTLGDPWGAQRRQPPPRNWMETTGITAS